MSQRAQRLIEAARKLPVPEGHLRRRPRAHHLGHHRVRLPDPRVQGPRPRPSTRRSTGSGSSCSSSRPGSSSRSSRRSGRAVADRRCRGIGGGPVVRKAAEAGSILAGVADRAVDPRLRACSRFTDRLFHGQEVLLVCFVIALATYAVQHITRGTFSGNGRFGPYGMILGAEGMFRIAPVIVARTPSASTTSSGTGSRWRSRRCSPASCRVCGPARPDRARPRRRVVGALDQPHAAVPRVARRPGPELRGRARRARARAGQGGARRRPPTSSSGSSSPASRSCSSRPSRPRCSRSSPRSRAPGSTPTSARGLKKLVMIVLGVGVLGVVAGATIGPTVGEILFGDKFNLGNRRPRAARPRQRRSSSSPSRSRRR